jgi:leucyl aminopeptidase
VKKLWSNKTQSNTSFGVILYSLLLDKEMRISYQNGDKPPKGYIVHIIKDDVENYAKDVATLGREKMNDFYADRSHWLKIVKNLKEYRKVDTPTILCFHGQYTSHSMYTRNVLQLLLQNLGLECYSKQCGKLIVYTAGETRKLWIEECIAETMFVIEAQLLAMLPANVATPKKMQQLISKLFRGVPNTRIRVISAKQLQKRGFGLITAVGKGAQVPPCMVVIERIGVSGGKRVALVGKGITFDSGGMSLKPTTQLMSMKYDKIGAVYAAYATYQLMRDPNLKKHTIIGVFPLAENALSERAVHSGDVVKSFIGKTVEITDPDAEGRLILADAFGLLHSYKPDVLLDIATLTGHAETIHCDHSGYFFASSEKWKHAVEKASFALGERMIAMPSWTSGYEGLLSSPVADLVNSPRKSECTSSSFVATLFLKEFVPKGCDWLHMDLAHETEGSVPIGHGIRTLIQAAHAWLHKN